MKVKIVINAENAAFEDDPGAEVARILEALAKRLKSDSYADRVSLMDANGNKVGEYTAE